MSDNKKRQYHQKKKSGNVGPPKPQEISTAQKAEVRGVLLSKIGGVLETEFENDYRKYVQSSVPWRTLGYASLLAYMRAMPDCVRVEFDEKVLQHRFFGIGAKDTYMSTAAKLAAGVKNTDQERIPANGKGMYALGYKKEDGPQTEEEARTIFSEIAEVAEIGMSPYFFFIRFWSEEDARKCYDTYREKFNMMIPKERKNRNQPQSKPKTNSAQSDADSDVSQSKPQQREDRQPKRNDRPAKVQNNNNSNTVAMNGNNRSPPRKNSNEKSAAHAASNGGEGTNVGANPRNGPIKNRQKYREPEVQPEMLEDTNDDMPELEDDDDMPPLEDDEDMLLVDDSCVSISNLSLSSNSHVPEKLLVVNDFPIGTHYAELMEHFNKLDMRCRHVQMVNYRDENIRTEAHVLFVRDTSVQEILEQPTMYNRYKGCQLSFKQLDESVLDGSMYTSSKKPVGMQNRVHNEMLHYIGSGTYLKMNLPLILDIRITHIVNHKFMFAHLMVLEPELRQLEKVIQGLNQIPHRKPVKSDSTYRGMAEYMGSFYRVYILDDKGEDYHVFFVDYGNEDWVPRSKIYEVPDQFWTQPPAAVPIYVLNVEGCSALEENSDVTVRYQRHKIRPHLEHIVPVSLI